MPEQNDNFAPFNFPTANKSIIKVIGVGGGGGNAVNHMFNEGIHDVSFVVCNTDSKALGDSPVPLKLQLGKEGLGAGNRPEAAKKATEESLDEVRTMLDDGTKMAFITAGMGGGTGTGAAPLIAKTAKDLDILTVGIVTIPFRWEGNRKIDQALDGVEEISKNVDALLVVNNERLREIYQDEGRVTKAIQDALHSPLLNDNDIYHSKKVLIHIIEPGPEGSAPLMMEEMNEINEFMDRMQIDIVETKWGLSRDPELQDKVKVTILASGFGVKDINSAEMDNRLAERDEEARRREAEEAERAAERRSRREGIYGSSSKNGYVHRPVYSYIFRDEDLDNDDVISSVESSPTYKRYKNTLRMLSQRSESKEQAPVAGDTITFGDEG